MGIFFPGRSGCTIDVLDAGTLRSPGKGLKEDAPGGARAWLPARLGWHAGRGDVDSAPQAPPHSVSTGCRQTLPGTASPDSSIASKAHRQGETDHPRPAPPARGEYGLVPLQFPRVHRAVGEHGELGEVTRVAQRPEPLGSRPPSLQARLAGSARKRRTRPATKRTDPRIPPRCDHHACRHVWPASERR